MAGGERISRVYDFYNGMTVEDYHLDNEFNRVHYLVNGRLGDVNIAEDANIKGTKLGDGTLPWEKLDPEAQGKVDEMITEAGLGRVADRSVEGIKLKEKTITQEELFAVTTPGGSEPNSLAVTDEKGAVGAARIVVNDVFEKIVLSVDLEGGEVAKGITVPSLQSHRSLAIGEDIWFLGGRTGGSSNYTYYPVLRVYNTRTKTVTAKASIESLYPTPYNHGLVSDKDTGDIYCFNGSNCYRYIASQNLWVQSTTAPSQFSGTTSWASAKGKIFFVYSNSKMNVLTVSTQLWSTISTPVGFNSDGSHMFNIEGDSRGDILVLSASGTYILNANTHAWTRIGNGTLGINMREQMAKIGDIIFFNPTGTYGGNIGDLYTYSYKDDTWCKFTHPDWFPYGGISLEADNVVGNGVYRVGLVQAASLWSSTLSETVTSNGVVKFGISDVIYTAKKHSVLSIRKGRPLALFNRTANIGGDSIPVSPGDEVVLINGFTSYEGEVEIIGQ